MRLLLILLLSATAAAQTADLDLTGLRGEPASLASLRGKVVVVNFWATWCLPCKEEMPMLSRLAREYEARGVVFIGANTDDAGTQANIPKFLRRTPVDFAVWKAATTADMERLGLGTALPATAFLDRDGRIAYRVLGPIAEAEVRERLEDLLSDRRGAAPAALVDNIEKALAAHEEETGHQHGSVALEGASSVPS